MIKNKKIVYIVIGVLVCLNIFAWIVVEEVSSSDYLEVVFFDVGQGDSIFIESPDGFQVLIDGGPDLSVLEKLGQEMPFYDRTIDLIVLTHPHRDHLSGLLEVLKRYEVKNILWTGAEEETANYKKWLKLIEEEDANIIIAQSNQEINLQRSDLYIFIHYASDEASNLNDTSIVMELIYGEVSFLFTGDISKRIEKQLDVDSDVLKIAHHGSKYSSSPEFLENVSPEIAVITVGENTYGHPDPGVLQTLEEFGINTLITKNYGDIRIVSDGINLTINN